MSTIESILNETRVFPPSSEFAKHANLPNMMAYESLCAQAEADYLGFWEKQANEHILWHKPFTRVLDESTPPFFKWFDDPVVHARLKNALQGGFFCVCG